MESANFIQAAATASLIAKMVVDGLKMAIDLPRWAPILLAFIAAMAAEFLLLLIQNASFTKQSVAQGVVIGLFAWSMAIGVTSLQSKADRVEERVQTALDLTPGSTTEDVDAAMGRRGSTRD